MKLLASGGAALAALLAMSGCGGGGSNDSTTYALEPTLSCLTAAGIDATEESATANPLAGGKPDISVDYRDYDVYVIVADDSSDAKKIASGVNALAGGLGGGDDFAVVKGNVVMYSNGDKISSDRQSQIEACLKE